MSSSLSNLLTGGNAKPGIGGLDQALGGTVDAVGLLASRTVDGVVDTAGLALDLVGNVADGVIETLDVLDPVLDQLSSQIPALDLAKLKSELVALTGQVTDGFIGGLGQAVSALGEQLVNPAAQTLPNALGAVTTALTPLASKLTPQPNAVEQLTGSLRPGSINETRTNGLFAPRPDGTQEPSKQNVESNLLVRSEASQYDDESAALVASTKLATLSETLTAQAYASRVPGLDEQLLFTLGLAPQSAGNTLTSRSSVGIEAQANPQQITPDRIPPFVDQALPAWQTSATSDGGSTSQALSQLQAAVIGFYARAPSPGSVAAELGHAHYGSYVHSLSYAEQRDYNLDVVREQMRRLGIAEPKLEAELVRLELFRPAVG